MSPEQRMWVYGPVRPMHERPSSALVKAAMVVGVLLFAVAGSALL